MQGKLMLLTLQSIPEHGVQSLTSKQCAVCPCSS